MGLILTSMNVYLTRTSHVPSPPLLLWTQPARGGSWVSRCCCWFGSVCASERTVYPPQTHRQLLLRCAPCSWTKHLLTSGARVKYSSRSEKCADVIISLIIHLRIKIYFPPATSTCIVSVYMQQLHWNLLSFAPFFTPTSPSV